MDIDTATDAEMVERFGMDADAARAAVRRVRASRVAQGLPPVCEDLSRTVRILGRSTHAAETRSESAA